MRSPSSSSLPKLRFYLPPKLEKAVARAMSSWTSHKMTQRLWDKDASLWTGQDENRWMGWLSEATLPRATLRELSLFQKEIFARQFTDIVVMGMGGSSLGPYVLDAMMPKLPGYGQLHVLDSTDPYIIDQLTAKIRIKSTLFIVASKSGGTLETKAFLDYFYQYAKDKLGRQASAHFVAITDPHTSLEAYGRGEHFWKIFHGNPHTGGRFSIFSHFGLVPACAAGLSLSCLKKELNIAHTYMRNQTQDKENIALQLGIAIGTIAQKSDLTSLILRAPPSLYPFMQWIEQIIAESTGKDHKGMLPIIDSHAPDPHKTGCNPFFIFFARHKEDAPEIQRRVKLLQKDNYPTLVIEQSQLQQTAQLCLCWELATSIACHFLKINPFNQPDVQSTKTKIMQLIDDHKNDSQLACSHKNCSDGSMTFCAPSLADAAHDTSTLLLKTFLQENNSDQEYLGLLCYMPLTCETSYYLDHIAQSCWQYQNRPVIIGFGPRYLHSTGQLFKGGPHRGRFIIVTHHACCHLPIPHKKLTFGALEKLQGLGDFLTLTQKGRPTLHIDINDSLALSLMRLTQLMTTTLTTL